jgi:NADPH:quinone reductase-like Zn-dependent oxidoreductase
MLMRALVTTEKGGPEVLRIEERSAPEPRRGQVRIAVRAAGVNFADILARVGLYPDAPKLPAVVGYEVAGELESVGEGVDSGLSPGDRVVAGTRFNGYAELAVADARAVVPLPEGWSFEEGAAMPVNYATAYGCLVRYGSLRQGERVLVQAAAGGVGIAATQIAKIVGAEVFGTASARKHDAVRQNGVDHPIDYRTEDFAKAVRRIAGSAHPLDLALDAIGGRSFKKGYDLLRAGGRLVVFGASAFLEGGKRNLPTAAKTLAQTPIFHPLQLMPSSRAVIGFNLLRLMDEGRIDDLMAPVNEWARAGRLRPIVAESFPLERGGEAHRYLQEGSNIGKVVLTT